MNQVIQMSQSGLSDELIVNQIKANGIASPITTNDLIQMKSTGVSDLVIGEMQTAGSAVIPNYRAPESYPASPVIHVEPNCPPIYGPPLILHHPPHYPSYRPVPRRAARPRGGFSLQF